MSKQEVKQITKISVNLGAPFFLVFLIFLALKLTNLVGWSWVWVTAPLWIPVGLLITVFIVILFIALMAFLFSL